VLKLLFKVSTYPSLTMSANDESAAVHPPNNLPRLNRYITTHDKAGVAVFDTQIEPEIVFKQLKGDAQFGLTYTTTKFPASISDDSDIKSYAEHLSSPPGISIANGSVLRYVDMAPGDLSPMHRTVSLDYGVVLEGEVECILDSGETRHLKRGDVVVQRGTMHAWRNTSKMEWARMLYCLLDAEDIIVDGNPLKEDYGGIPDTKPSKG
jgi:quercetin dioxygenase-like cupin family protein